MSFLPLSRAQAPVPGTNGDSHQVSYLPPHLHRLYPRDMCPELSPSGPVPSPQAHESQGGPSQPLDPSGSSAGLSLHLLSREGPGGAFNDGICWTLQWLCPLSSFARDAFCRASPQLLPHPCALMSSPLAHQLVTAGLGCPVSGKEQRPAVPYELSQVTAGSPAHR